MRTKPASTRSAALLLLMPALALGLSACGESEPEFAETRRTEAPTTRTVTAPASTPSSVPSDSPSTSEPSTSNSSSSIASADRIPDAPPRDLVPDTGSRSTLGRTRDSALDVRNGIQGGQDPTLAATRVDEEYARVANLRWDMPSGWRIAIPQDANVIAEMATPSTNGMGRILFSRTDDAPRRVIQDWTGIVLSEAGNPADAQITESEILGRTMTRTTLRGTYLETGRENPFYEVNIAIIALGDGSSAVLTWIAPEVSVAENQAAWEALLSATRVE